jgi:hypothetical protein
MEGKLCVEKNRSTQFLSMGLRFVPRFWMVMTRGGVMW